MAFDPVLIFVALVVIAAGFAFGFFPRSLIGRLVLAVVLAVVIVAAVNARWQGVLFHADIVATKFVERELMGLLAFGYGSMLISSVLGWTRQARQKAQQEDETQQSIRDMTLNDFTDYIDRWINSAPEVANNPWLANVWHSLTPPEKSDWVKQREPHLRPELSRCRTAVDVLLLMQDADKKFARSGAPL